MRKMMIAACTLSLTGCAGTYADVNHNTQVAVHQVNKSVSSVVDTVVAAPANMGKAMGDALTPTPPKPADKFPPLK